MVVPRTPTSKIPGEICCSVIGLLLGALKRTPLTILAAVAR
jgi:hypothetical protein